MKDSLPSITSEVSLTSEAEELPLKDEIILCH
jgi:hypothetical protein